MYGVCGIDLLHDDNVTSGLAVYDVAKSQTARNQGFASMLDGLLRAVTRRAVIPFYGQRYRRFLELLQRARDRQREWLFARIRRCRDTRFGNDHNLAGVRTLADFRRHVPIMRYDNFAPYIDAVARGQFSALFPADEQVLRFTITTGSTGVPKLNPVTSTWLQEYRNAWDLWGVKTLLDHPAQVGGKILQMAGTWNMGRTPAGIPISMVSALVSRYQNPVVKHFYAIPNEVPEIRDPTARYYTMLRLSIVQRIGLIVLMNPGTLLRLAELGNEHRAALIRDVNDGTLSAEFDIPADIRGLLAPRICRPNPRLAKALARIVETTGTLYPRDYWSPPIIGCWLGGTAGYQARYLHEHFPRSPLRDLGLVSSEGRHTIPIEDNSPAGVLSASANFYEFVPVGEIDGNSPAALEGHELVEGQDYYLLMTTSAGYYRFNIGDIVRCRGFVGQAPLLEFLQKGDRCGDLEGEKVTEHQFMEAAGLAAGDLGLRLGHVTAVPVRPARDLPCYVFLVDQQDLPAGNQARDFLSAVDRGLSATNFLYSARRREQVLGPPRLWRLPKGAWLQFVESEIARRGTGDVHYKPAGLVQDAKLLDHFPNADVVTLRSRSVA
jgi:hypothetical protein